MTETYYYFDDQALYQADWKKTIGVSLYDGRICGIGNDLFVFADASGMQVKVKSGAAHVKGIYYFSDAEKTLPISLAPGTVGHSRYDLVVVEVNWSAKAAVIKIVEGSAGASPALPTLTQSASLWQLPLASILVEYGVTNIAAAKITPYHSWALGSYFLPFVIGSGLSTIALGPTPTGIAAPLAGKIFRVDMFANEPGSIVIDLWKDLSTAYPPTVADTVCESSNKASLSTAQSGSKFVWGENTYKNANSLYWPGYVIDKPVPGSQNPYVFLANVDSVATMKQIDYKVWIAKSISPQA